MRSVLSAQAGNYVRDGILAGIRRFVDEGGEAAAAEVHVGYGKDYCAAVGAAVDLLVRRGKGVPPRWSTAAPGAEGAPPFWDELNRWYRRQYFLSTGARGGCCGVDDWDEAEEAEWGVLGTATVGIYEGETVVFPVIAAGDLETLRWLFGIDPGQRRKGSRCASARTRARARSRWRARQALLGARNRFWRAKQVRCEAAGARATGAQRVGGGRAGGGGVFGAGGLISQPARTKEEQSSGAGTQEAADAASLTTPKTLSL